MQINDKLITSIESLKRHFDFQVVFGNIDIFVRDLAPNEIPYFNETDLLLYKIIASPHNTEFDGDSMIYGDNQTYKLQKNDVSVFNNDALSGYTTEEKIRIIALYELIGKPVDYLKTQPLAMNEISEGELILMKGQSLSIVKVGVPVELYSRLIRINKNVDTGFRVGQTNLKAGSIAYGLFSKSGLYKLLKPYDCNNAYELQLVEEDNRILLCVTDKINKQEYKLVGIKSFCTFGKDNYIYIANNRVYSQHDYQLQKKLNNEIGILDIPLAVEIANGVIIITMNNGIEKRINYKL